MAQRVRRVVLVAACLAAVAACGSDDEGSSDEAPEAFIDPPRGGECNGTDLTYTNLSTGEEVEIVDTGAVALADGAAFTAYLADYELSDDDFGIVGPEVPADGDLVVLSVTVFNAATTPEPLEDGTQITYTEDFGELTFTVVHQDGGEAFGNAAGAAGTVLLTNVSDGFCAEVDYADDEKELSGTIEAEIERSL